MSLQVPGLGREKCAAAKGYNIQVNDHHLQLDTPLLFFSVSSYQVLISPRPCFLGTWLLLRLALITLDQAGKMLFVLIETLRVHLLLAACGVLVLRGGERA